MGYDLLRFDSNVNDKTMGLTFSNNPNLNDWLGGCKLNNKKKLAENEVAGDTAEGKERLKENKPGSLLQNRAYLDYIHLCDLDAKVLKISALCAENY